MKFILVLFCFALMALAQKPLRTFHDGEALKVDGGTVRIIANKQPYSGNGAVDGFFVFEPDGTELSPFDYIEIMVGIEVQTEPSLLRFKHYSSSVYPGKQSPFVSVGEIEDITKIRTVEVRLFKTSMVKSFR